MKSLEIEKLRIIVTDLQVASMPGDSGFKSLGVGGDNARDMLTTLLFRLTTLKQESAYRALDTSLQQAVHYIEVVVQECVDKYDEWVDAWIVYSQEMQVVRELCARLVEVLGEQIEKHAAQELP